MRELNFETGIHQVAHAGLELKSSRLSLLSGGITGVQHHKHVYFQQIITF